jgi:hypothetical protein
MKKWGRILLNTLTAISLLLALATAGLWVRTGIVHDIFIRFDYFQTAKGVVSASTRIRSADGCLSYEAIAVEEVGAPFFTEPFDRSWHYHRYAASDQGSKGWATRSAFVPGFTVDEVNFFLHVPLGSLCIASLLLPTLRGVKWANQLLRARPGHCPACGYDMRANPARCSECGHEPTPVTT